MKNPENESPLKRKSNDSEENQTRYDTSYLKSNKPRKKFKDLPPAETITESLSSCSQPETEACIDQEQLQILERMFEETADHTGALTMESFQKVMKEAFSSLTDEAVEYMFWKVDADCDGLVTWRKYLDYLMREFQGKEEMRKGQYRLRLQPPMRIVPLNHGHEIVKLQFLASSYKGSSGRFLTVTKDGILQFWDETFKLLRTVHLDQTNRRHTQQMWVNDMVCLGNINLMAIASTDQDLEFFDIGGNKCQRSFIFIDLDSCALVMDYWTDQQKGVFCVGDTKGNVLIFVSDDIMDSGLFHPSVFQHRTKIECIGRTESGPCMKISMQNLLTKKSRTHRSYRLKAIHSNWCQQIKFLPQINLVASCSAIDNTAMVLTIVPSINDQPRTSTMTSRKGILCFDYCPDRNFLVTGGYDPIILLWNPLFIKKPMWRMKGHQTSVTHVVVNGKSSCIISISKDKNIRLWDTHNFLCFQSFSGRFFALGNHPITSVYFHMASDTFICGTYSIGILNGYLEAQVGNWKKMEEENTTHHTSLCGILYSKTFRQVVSGCLNGVVSVWEMMTGKKVMEFASSDSKDMELTAMALDELERCLITGMRNGTVKMWNYNIGVCLLNFPNPDQMEVNGVAHMNGVFYVTGWSKRITWFLYRNNEAVPLFDYWPYYHTEDILFLAKYRNNILGSASYNGDIFIWNVNWGKPLVYFNASKSPGALKPKKVFKEEYYLTLADLMNRTANKVKVKSWAKKNPWRPSSRSSDKTQMQRNLMSAPPVIKGLGANTQSKQRAPLSSQKPFSANIKPAQEKTKLQDGTWTQNRVLKKENEDYIRQEEKQSVTSVEKIIFLPTRQRTPRTATLLSSGGNGIIYAWSIHDKGGMLGKFKPAGNENQDSVVGAMASDEKDWILVTGDSKGYIKIWDIKEYCRPASEQKLSPVWEDKEAQENTYRKLIFAENKVAKQPEPPLIPEEEVNGGHSVSLIPPELLISWRSHNGGVTDIVYGDRFHVIISAGADFNVKAWTIFGEAIGTFGLHIWRRLVPVGKLENLKKMSIHETTEEIDLKETFKEDEYTKVLREQRKDQLELMSLLHSKSPEAMAKLKEMAEQSMLGSAKAGEGIEDSWNKWTTSGMMRSDIVGRAYKPKERLRKTETMMSPMRFMTEREISPWIYRSLPYKELQDLTRSNMAIMKTTKIPKKKHVWVVTQQIIRSLALPRQLSIDASMQSQSFSYSTSLNSSSKTSSVTSISSFKLSSDISSLSSLKQTSVSSSAASRKQFYSSTVSSKKRMLSNSSLSMATKLSLVATSMPSVKKPSIPEIKPLKSILSSRVRF
ncbi:EF-hand calcium-binding domain-containing protein 8 isoform X1 [Monodelphis domestica]|uniref:EF-hand calcium-binding domain-containing protein 8 isoform X1 n=2 Tax=Monodelphis domestica TaxID=13616 RepID=UPI0024E265C7|nr:EF-hand calcium-binding domain-containing protein 8 isoform X1 [Monodelphis domestica]